MKKISDKDVYRNRRIVLAIIGIILLFTISFWLKYFLFFIAIALPIALFIPNKDNGVEYYFRNSDEFPVELRIGIILFLMQFSTYIMCIYRWFNTEHFSFWIGFKELIWALFPIVNFTYVWDIWFNIIFIFIPNFYRMIWNIDL
jgi:hypothetical protein